MSVLRFGHIGICVSDMDASVAFYRDLLGFRRLSKVTVSGADADKLLRLSGVDQETVFLERDNVRLALFEFRNPKPLGDGQPRAINELGVAALMLRVDDLESTLTEMRAAGVKVLDETRSDHAAYGSKLVFLTDPDGTLVELIEIPGDPYPPFGTPLDP